MSKQTDFEAAMASRPEPKATETKNAAAAETEAPAEPNTLPVAANRKEHATAAIIPFSDVAQAAMATLGELGMEDPLDVNDVDEHLGNQTPLLKIQHKPGTTDDGRELVEGHYTHAMTGDQYANPRASLLIVAFGRQWLKPYNPSDPSLKVYCSSSDGRQCDLPEDRSEDVGRHMGEGHPCAECQHAKWSGKEKPECGELYRCLLWLHDDGGESIDEPVAFIMRSTAIKPLRALRSRIKAAGAQIARKYGLPMTAAGALVTFEMGVKKIDGPNPYYVPTFSAFGETDAERVEALVSGLVALAPTFRQFRAEDHETADDVDPGAPTANGSNGNGAFSADEFAGQQVDQDIPF